MQTFILSANTLVGVDLTVVERRWAHFPYGFCLVLLTYC